MYFNHRTVQKRVYKVTVLILQAALVCHVTIFRETRWSSGVLVAYINT